MALGLFGVVLNISWLRLTDYGKFLAEKWREDAREIARTDPAVSAAFRALLKNPRIAEPSGAKPSKVIKNLVVIFFLLWELLLMFGIMSFLGHPIAIP